MSFVYKYNALKPFIRNIPFILKKKILDDWIRGFRANL